MQDADENLTVNCSAIIKRGYMTLEDFEWEEVFSAAWHP